MNTSDGKERMESPTEMESGLGTKASSSIWDRIRGGWLGLVILAVVLTGCGGYRIWSVDHASTGGSEPDTAVISRGDISISGLGSGTLVPAGEKSFGFESGGVVDQVLVGIGDEVQQGDTLATLIVDDLVQELNDTQSEYRELTSPVSIAAASLEVVQAERAVMNAEGELKFLISPYVYQSEIRLQEAQAELQEAVRTEAENPTQEAGETLAAAQQKVDHASASVEANWKTYYDKYVPDFFNFPWTDRFGFRHDYFDPPSETEISSAWAALDKAKARLEAGQMYLAALQDGDVPENAYGSEITNLEQSADHLADASANLEAAALIAPMDGMITDLNLSATDQVDSSDVVTIARLDPPTLDGYFDESDWSLVAKGNPVEVVFDALPTKVYQGQIVFVDPVLQDQGGSTSVYAVVELDTASTGWADLPLGSSASLEIIADQAQNALLVPLDALQEDNGDTGTVLLDENGELITTDIQLGLRNVLYGEVLSGLSEGDKVVLGYSN